MENIENRTCDEIKVGDSAAENIDLSAYKIVDAAQTATLNLSDTA
jgi:hypothetical protein